MSSHGDQFQKAVVFHGQGRLAEAETLYREILRSEPQHADALHALGVLALQRNHLGESVRLIHAALGLMPDNVLAWSNYGTALLKAKRLEEALASYDRALTLRPDFAEVVYNRANALLDLNRLEEALAGYDRALALRPDYVEAWGNRGKALLKLKRPDEALASYDQALALRPDFTEALIDRGGALRELKRLDEALASYDRGLAIRPETAEGHYNRANVLRDLKRVDEALASYAQALRIRPDYAEAHWNEANCLLLMGDFRGWEKYEWRWRVEPHISWHRGFRQPLWLGAEDIAGKRLLLHADQGLGDTLHFCRYATLAAERGAHVILELQPALKTLLTSLDGASELVAWGEPLPAFDFHCPLTSLPLAFKTTLSTIPARTPYLKPPPARVAQWDAVLGERRGPRIGVVWSGSPTHINDAHRSLTASRLVPPLLAASISSGHVSFFGLQKEYRPEDRAWLDAHPQIRHFAGQIQDFADTAALAQAMDLVISVDTSVAHMAGAIGRPVWIMLAYLGLDRRWMLEREDSPWYPAARLYRQPAIDAWDDVIAAVARDLPAFCGGKR